MLAAVGVPDTARIPVMAGGRRRARHGHVLVATTVPVTAGAPRGAGLGGAAVGAGRTRARDGPGVRTSWAGDLRPTA
ncbi:hypothetical protein STAFG_1620 [Streptomyces afghaniensis 772]|uniref:Uncharacterized protein n=1 Tax=Streptomyces afghaniensis 772 TaxID=1283301 RepID=S4MZ11_9ACTN|nr:hypothetical protein STAFG_1620 [Streptomyces afghaniensis 772]